MATILIVDECPENRKLFAAPLEHQGHRLLEAADGANALALARTKRPQLIIADARVPMMDRFEIVHHLRSDRNLAQTRIILYSDRDFQREAIALIHAIDVPAILPKPRKPEEVVSMVDLVLNWTGESAKSAALRRRRIDREHPRPSSKNWTQDAAQLERLTAENERLMAELRCRAEELNREAIRREQAERTLKIIQERNQLTFCETSDLRLQALFDNALDAILLADDKKRFVDVNPAACQMLGYSRDELLQMNLLDITPSQNHAIALDLWQRFMAVGKLHGEYTVICKDGTVREVEYRAVAHALPGLHLSLMQDITERKRAEKQLRESEEQFRQLAEHIGEVFWIHDSKLARVSYISPAYEKICGRTCESLYRSPQSWTESLHPADRDRIIEATTKIYTHATYDETYRIVRPDNSIRWIRSRAFPVYNTAGQVIRMAGIAEDITDLKLAEEELRRHAQRLETVSEIDHAILAARSSQEIAQAVVSRIRPLVPCQRASVVTFDFEAGQALFVAVSVNGESHLSSGTCIPIDAIGDLQDLRMGQVRIVEDFLALSERPPAAEAILAEGIRSQIICPIVSQNELIGLLKLGREQPGAFDQEHVELAREISDRVAVAMQDARLFEQVRSGRERMRALTGQLMKAQEDERRRISRELHDEIGQALTVTKISLQAMDRTAEDFALATQHTMETIESVVQQVRNLSLDLRPPMLDDFGLVAALRSYLDRQAQLAGFLLRFELDPIADGLTSEIETACFRVTQEALTNIIRHARPSRVRVELRQHDAELQLLIRDDGVGFDVAAARQRAVRGESLGLLGMEERVKLLGGRIDIESAPQRGTEIRVHFPMQLATLTQQQA